MYDEIQATDNLCFEDWCTVNRDVLDIIFAENGADRELDFDWEKDAEDIYIKLTRQGE